MGMILVSPSESAVEGPVVFLAGPTHGAPDWQSDAIGYLSVNESISIVSPRQSRDESVPLSSNESAKQILWEQLYIVRALEGGAVMFWFAKPIAGIATPYYAQQSFFELGDVLARAKAENLVVIGMEKDFPNAEYLIGTLKKKYPNIVVHETIKKVCDETLRLIRTQYI